MLAQMGDGLPNLRDLCIQSRNALWRGFMCHVLFAFSCGHCPPHERNEKRPKGFPRAVCHVFQHVTYLAKTVTYVKFSFIYR